METYVPTASEMRYGEAHLQRVYQAQLKNRKKASRKIGAIGGYSTCGEAYPTAPAEFQ